MANPFTLSNIELMMLLIIITILLFFSSCEGTRCYSPPSIPVCKTSTVVFKCAKMENSDLIRAVLPYYNIKSLDCNGMTPLHYAVIEGRHEIVEAILEIDVGRQSVCIKDIWGMNTFHWGAVTRDNNILDMLLFANNTCSGEKDMQGFTPFNIIKNGCHSNEQ